MFCSVCCLPTIWACHSRSRGQIVLQNFLRELRVCVCECSWSHDWCRTGYKVILCDTKQTHRGIVVFHSFSLVSVAGVRSQLKICIWDKSCNTVASPIPPSFNTVQFSCIDYKKKTIGRIRILPYQMWNCYLSADKYTSIQKKRRITTTTKITNHNNNKLCVTVKVCLPHRLHLCDIRARFCIVYAWFLAPIDSLFHLKLLLRQTHWLANTRGNSSAFQPRKAFNYLTNKVAKRFFVSSPILTEQSRFRLDSFFSSYLHSIHIYL